MFARYKIDINLTDCKMGIMRHGYKKRQIRTPRMRKGKAIGVNEKGQEANERGDGKIPVDGERENCHRR